MSNVKPTQANRDSLSSGPYGFYTPIALVRRFSGNISKNDDGEHIAQFLAPIADLTIQPPNQTAKQLKQWLARFSSAPPTDQKSLISLQYNEYKKALNALEEQK